MLIPDVDLTPVWQDAIDGWLLHMQCEGFSQTTITSRKSAVRILARCMIEAGRADPAEVTRADLTQYMWNKRNAGRLSAVVSHHSNLAKFWDWWSADEGAPNPMAKVPAPKQTPPPPPDVLTDKELATLLADCAGNSTEAIRNRAMILVLASSGLRRAELAALTLEDVNVSQRTVIVRAGKGGKWRMAVISKAASLALSKYLRRRSRMAPGTDRVFLSCKRGGPLTASGVTTIFYQLQKRTGVSCHPHRFRHRWAHKNLAAGISETNLMRLAGWSSTQMFQRYGAALADERAVAAGLAIADEVG